MIRLPILVSALSLALAMSPPVLADEQAAIDGCIDAVRSTGGPDAAGGQVLSSDFSEAGTVVMLQDAGGTVWKCLAYSDGTVGDLSIAEAMDDGGGAMAPAGDSTGMSVTDAPAIVQFEQGRSGATLSGAIVGDGLVDYALEAGAGQTMNVDLQVDGTNGDGTIYFNILPPGSAGEAIFIGSMDGNSASVPLTESGTYLVRVYLMGNDRDTDKTVGYTLDVSID